EWQMVSSLLEELRSGRLEADVVALSSCASAYRKGGRPDLALASLREMRQGLVKLDVIAFGSAISACAAGALWERAGALLIELEQ
ncbi:unnamed protein product, partial [Polarella glacialis]